MLTRMQWNQMVFGSIKHHKSGLAHACTRCLHKSRSVMTSLRRVRRAISLNMIRSSTKMASLPSDDRAARLLWMAVVPSLSDLVHRKDWSFARCLSATCPVRAFAEAESSDGSFLIWSDLLVFFLVAWSSVSFFLFVLVEQFVSPASLTHVWKSLNLMCFRLVLVAGCTYLTQRY